MRSLVDASDIETTRARLDSLFHPGTVGVLGYSSTPGRWGNRIVATLQRGSFAGQVVVVRPKNPPTSIQAVETLEGIDLLVVLVPAPQVADAVAEARAADVGAVVVLSAGFAEIGPEGAALQAEVVKAAGDMPVLGPNCVGLVSGLEDLRVTVNSRIEERQESFAGPVAIVSQSGAVGMALTAVFDERGIGWSYFASTGNEAVTGLGEIADYLLHQDEVRVLVMYVESLHDAGSYRRLGATALKLGKRVVVLKSGISESSQRAALSHTAAVAGDFLLFSGLSVAEGMVVVRDEEELVEAAYAALAPVEVPSQPRIGVVTVSGGVGALLADQVADSGAVVPELDAQSQEKLRQIHAGLASTANPIDLAGTFPVQTDSLMRILTVLDESPTTDCIVLSFVQGHQHIHVFRELVALLPTLRKPAWFVWVGGEASLVEPGGSTGLVFDSIPRFARMFRRLPTDHGLLPDVPDVTTDLGVLADSAGVRTEHEVAPLLVEAGATYPSFVTASDVEALIDAVRSADIPAPWVLKVDCADIAHRAKHGLVELGLANVDELRDAALRMDQIVKTQMKPKASWVFMAQAQAANPQAMFGLGLVRSEQFGPMIIVGPGGADVEAVGARRCAVPIPLSATGLGLVAGYLREEVDADVSTEALAALLAALSAVGAHSHVAEVDINPVLAFEGGSLMPVDALGVMQPPA